MKMPILVASCVITFIICPATAQTFNKANQMSIFPSQVLIENYTIVPLSQDNPGPPPENLFDIKNPYTFLQVISDKNGREYHILYQTDFFGKILFLAYSNNLSPVFNNKEKPFFGWQLCIRKLNQSIFSLQNSDVAVNCMLERLNYCAE